MKVWVIGRSYPLPINNMQGSFELEQAKMLAKYGNNVTYLSCIFHPFKKVKKWGFISWDEDGIQICTYSIFYAIERMKLHLNHFQASIWNNFLRKVELQSGLPDVIHIHYPANITVADIILRYKRRGVKIVCTEHWSQVQRKVIDHHEVMQLRRYVNEADAFLCVGPPLKKAVAELTNSNREIFVVPNVANDLFKPRLDPYEKFTFVAVGVLFPHKQFDKIIEAFRTVQKRYKKIDLIIVGGGPEEKPLKEKIRSYKLEDNIQLTGKLNRNETAKVVGRSSALICYSSFETFGVPIIEAWGCGLPVIATTTTAVIEEWDQKTGIQVSPNNLAELEKAMATLIESIDTYDPEYIRNYAMSRYSEDTIYHELVKYYSGEK